MKEIKISKHGFVTKIDDEDYVRVSEHNWSFSSGYAKTKIDGKFVQLHRFLTNPLFGEFSCLNFRKSLDPT